jgi:hypothetical protein
MSASLTASGGHPVVYCDTVASAGMHNGNARILMTRFDVSDRVAPRWLGSTVHITILIA